jgi:hypothetical protein
MAVALILTIIPVTLIVVLLVLTTGGLSPLAAVGFAFLLGLVVIVFAGLLRAARLLQPSGDGGDRTRSEDPYEPAEEQPDPASIDSANADDPIARWANDGGSARP